MAREQVQQVQARRLLLRAQCLSGRPAGLAATVEKLGFVQLDSINAVARAQDLILHNRVSGYQPEGWHDLLTAGQVFEHWTHDASIIPCQFLPYWRLRFAREARRIRTSTWWTGRLGEDPEPVLERIRQQLRERGPMLARDFPAELPHDKSEGQGWWNWRPEKAALEYLWRSGELIVTERRNFHKVYQLRDPLAGEAPSHQETVDWACREALRRLGVATPAQLAGFWGLVSLAEARAWCESGPQETEAVIDPAGRLALAVAGWRKAAEAARPSTAMRLLAPFDPILRDRNRTELLFDFDYRFEAFVPKAKRVYGYYTLPILDGERLVGRLTPKLHRRQALLEIEQIEWEKGVVLSGARLARLELALRQLADFLGASQIRRPANP